MSSVELCISVAVLGVATHLIFKHHEPTSPLPVFLALLLVPPLPSYALNSSLLLAYILYPAFLLLSIALYRLSPWHPLAAFPGPRLARLSKFWGIYTTSTGRQHTAFLAPHARHGPIVRVGPNELSIADPATVVPVLGEGGLPKGHHYAARQDPHAPANLIVLNGAAHARRRRRWNAGMGADARAEYLPVLMRRARLLVKRVGDAIDGAAKETDGAGAKVDIAQWIRYFSFDFTGDMAFGGGFEMLRDGGDTEGLTHLFDSAARVLSHVGHIPWAAQTLRCIPGATATVLKMRAFGVRCATKRIERGAEVKDLWYHLSDEAGAFPPKPPLAEVIADGALVILAGSDTTTTTTVLSALIYLLLTHPECFKRLQAEVDDARETADGVLDPEHLEQMPFLNACLNETMRLHPAVPVGGPRRVPDDGPSRVIAGRVVPPGTEIYVPPLCLHRDPQSFAPHTDDFWPDRWILADASSHPVPPASAQPKLIAHKKLAFIPFSYGPQNCAGKPLALLEMRVVTALLLREFDMQMVSESVRWSEGLRDYFILERGPLVVRMEKRIRA